jgi:cell division protein FtsB
MSAPITAPMASQLLAGCEAAAVQIAMLREYGNLCATNESVAKERDQLRAEVARLSALRALDMHDKPDQWTKEIDAAHPMETETDSYGRDEIAMKMVGNRHGKYELVDLVNWLLKCADDAKAERSNSKKVERANARAERAEAEVKRLKSDGAASAFINMSCRASRAEAELATERARLDAVVNDCWVIHKGNENAFAVRSLGEYITPWVATPRAAIDAAMKQPNT